jgi:hypothetical protein
MHLSLKQPAAYLVALFVSISLLSDSFAATPNVRRITPAGVTAGTPRTITIYGERLGDVIGVQFYDEGLKATNFESVADNHIKFQVESDAQLNNNLYAFRLLTKSGLSNLRYLSVHRFPSVNEVEPNSDFAAPQLVALRNTVDGTVQNEDVDYYAVDLKLDQSISVEVEGLRHAFEYNFFDPSVTIYDADRFEVASSDDSALLRQDCVCSYKATKEGRFIIEVREAAFGGSDDCLYRLHISDYSRPVTLIPAGGKPGEVLQTTLIDDLGNAWTESFQLPAEPNEQFAVWSVRDGVQASSPNYINVSAMDNHVEAEPNGDMSKITAVPTLPAAFHGVLQETNDEDFFVFHATKDQQYEIRSVARKLIRSPADTVINIFKVGGGHITGSDDSNGPDAFIDFKVPEDGDYAIRVRDHLSKGGLDFTYRVEVMPKVAAVFPTIVEQERIVSQTAVIPRGARTAIEVAINRQYIGGDAELKIEGLPEGVTYETFICPGDVATIPVVISASEQAAPMSSLVNMTATITQGETKFTGKLRQHTQILRGQNDRDLWGHESDRLPIAVTDPAPFDIEVIQPTVPLVRDGSLDVKLKLTRKEGFNEVVGLRFLYNAPGMSANGSVQFQKDQTEVVIPVTANGNAKLGKWNFAILAWTGVNGGVVKISSKPFTIEIADRLFNFAFNKTMAEQGKPVDVVIGAEITRAVEGKIELEMVGIPPGTTCDAPKLVFDPASNQVVYKLTVPADAKTGSFKTIACRATVTSDAGVITQTNGTGEVQIDVPLPTNPAPTPEPTPQPVAQAEQPAAPKVLTRLEQLKAMRQK